MDQDNYEKTHVSRARTTVLAAIDYGLNIVLLGAFYLLDIISLQAFALISLVCLVFAASFLFLIASGLSKRFRDPAMTTAQVSVACFANLLGAILAPQIIYVFLMNLYIPLAYCSLHFNLRGFINIWLVIAIPFTLVIYLTDPIAFVDLSSPANRFMFALIIALAFARFLFISAEFSKIRRKLKERNHDLQRVSGKLRELAEKDHLTGIANRRTFLNQLAEECHFERGDKELFVCLIDVDYFKNVNDNYGHMVGDQVICSVAECLSTKLRRCDCVARYGGEEFAVLISDSCADDTVNALERARVFIEELSWATYGIESQITISLGLAKWQAGEDPKTVLKNADEALYQAKTQGRNRLVIYA